MSRSIAGCRGELGTREAQGQDGVGHEFAVGLVDAGGDGGVLAAVGVGAEERQRGGGLSHVRPADDVGLVLVVVVERLLDEVEASGGQRHQRHPPIVIDVAELEREREHPRKQRRLEHHRGAGNGVGEEEGFKIGVIILAEGPEGVGEDFPVGGDDAHVGIDQRGVAGGEAGEERGKLARLPVVVLIAQADQVGGRQGCGAGLFQS